MLEVFRWIHAHETGLWWLGIGSAIAFVGILMAVPLWIARLPRDYFARESKSVSESASSWKRGLRSLRVIVRNMVGAVLIIAGLAMLVLPGQGILTILVGLMMTDFPGKRRVERRLIRRPAVARAINWIREKANRPPLEVPANDHT